MDSSWRNWKIDERNRCSFTFTHKTIVVTDAENRLQSLHPEPTGPGGTPLQDDLWVSFTYDWRGRRVRKLIEAYDVSHEWYTVADLRYLYDLPWTGGGREASSFGAAVPLVQGEWNLLVEFEASGEEPFVHQRK